MTLEDFVALKILLDKYIAWDGYHGVVLVRETVEKEITKMVLDLAKKEGSCESTSSY